MQIPQIVYPLWKRAEALPGKSKRWKCRLRDLACLFQGAWVEGQNRPRGGAGARAALQPPCPCPASMAAAHGVLPTGRLSPGRLGRGGWRLRGAPARAGPINPLSVPSSPTAPVPDILPWKLSLAVAKSCVGLLVFFFLLSFGGGTIWSEFEKAEGISERQTVKPRGPFYWFVSSEPHCFAGQLLLLSDLRDWLILLWGEIDLLKNTLLNRYSS